VAESDTDSDARWMHRAVQLAWQARPSPNPRVGSVVVRDGTAIGEGFHRAAGEMHGEIAALTAVHGDARGAVVYVTLEPCNHFGRTPPCTEALVRAGVRRVVVGAREGNPHVTGHGVERLREAGIEVTVGVQNALCERLVRPWRKHVTTGIPYVTLKTAMSLDGRTGTRERDSRWITGEAARYDAHELRSRSDAVLIGIGTVLDDDPLLTPRGVPSVGPPPVRIVLDTRLRLPLDRALVRSAREAPVWVLHGPDASPEHARELRDRGVTLLETVATDGCVDVTHALRLLGERGIVEVLVEGGATVHGSFVDARLADAWVAYIAPVVIGGARALPTVAGLGIERMSAALRVRDPTVEQLGDDFKITGEFTDVHGNHFAAR